MRDIYYFAAAANILNAIEQEGDPRIVMARALHLGCIAMRKLTKELSEGGEMEWAIQHLTSAAMAEVTPEAMIPRSEEGVILGSPDHKAREMVEGAATLLDVFLKEEERVFRQAEVPEPAIRFICSQAKESIGLLDHALKFKRGRSQPTWERLRQSVTELGEEICLQAQHLEDSQKMRKY